MNFTRAVRPHPSYENGCVRPAFVLHHPPIAAQVAQHAIPAFHAGVCRNCSAGGGPTCSIPDSMYDAMPSHPAEALLILRWIGVLITQRLQRTTVNQGWGFTQTEPVTPPINVLRRMSRPGLRDALMSQQLFTRISEACLQQFLWPNGPCCRQ